MRHSPDDEALSAHLDGEGDPAMAEHLASCATCAARLEDLRAAVNAIGSPVVARPEAVRAAAVASAARVANDGGDRSRRVPPAWLAAAAVVVVLLAAIPIVLSQRGRNGELAHRSGTPTAGEGATGFEAAPPEELGAQSDPQALARLLDERMRAPRAMPGEAFAATEAAGDAAEDGGGGGGSAGAATSGPPCLGEARDAGANKVGSLLYTGMLEWQSMPAVVHVFAAPDPQAQTLTRRAFVMARSDCQLLVAPSF